MKSKDEIEDKFVITLDGEQGTCADVQEEIYASTFLFLVSVSKQNILLKASSFPLYRTTTLGIPPTLTLFFQVADGFLLTPQQR